MKKTKQEELLQILTQSTDWISSSSLATLMGVSQRTIRNYVNAINSNALADIESSKSGYKLNKKVPASIDKEPLMDERIYFTILLCQNCLPVQQESLYSIYRKDYPSVKAPLLIFACQK